MPEYDVVMPTAVGLDAAVPMFVEAVRVMDTLTSLIADGGRALRDDMNGVPRREYATLVGLDYQLASLSDEFRAFTAEMSRAAEARRSGAH